MKKRRAKETNEHARTRTDHASELAEDYVEAIAEMILEEGLCRGVDLARRFAVSKVTVSRMVSRLQRDGYVETEPYGPIQLTRKGTQLAEDCRRRHEIVQQFLISIGVDEETARIDAEGIEHHVSPITLKCMQAVSEQRRSS